jgi:hypothetical protein
LRALVARAARLVEGRDLELLVGQGTTLGLALQGLTVIAGRAVGGQVYEARR